MEALDEAQALKTPGEDAMKYMVLHKKDPVIESYYTAQYSSFGDGADRAEGYYQDETDLSEQKADDILWDSLQPQIDRIVEEAGLQVCRKRRILPNG